jgi:hypothetical protein
MDQGNASSPQDFIPRITSSQLTPSRQRILLLLCREMMLCPFGQRHTYIPPIVLHFPDTSYDHKFDSIIMEVSQACLSTRNKSFRSFGNSKTRLILAPVVKRQTIVDEDYFNEGHKTTSFRFRTTLSDAAPWAASA